jgi:hypothetical protein
MESILGIRIISVIMEAKKGTEAYPRKLWPTWLRCNRNAWFLTHQTHRHDVRCDLRWNHLAVHASDFPNVLYVAILGSPLIYRFGFHYIEAMVMAVELPVPKAGNLEKTGTVLEGPHISEHSPIDCP